MIEWRARLRVFEELFPFSAYHAAGLSQGLTHWSRSVLTCSVAPIKSPLHIDITAFLKRFARLMLLEVVNCLMMSYLDRNNFNS